MLLNRKDFFANGKAIAKALDESKSLIKQKIMSFEDTEDLAINFNIILSCSPTISN